MNTSCVQAVLMHIRTVRMVQTILLRGDATTHSDVRHRYGLLCQVRPKHQALFAIQSNVRHADQAVKGQWHLKISVLFINCYLDDTIDCRSQQEHASG